MRAKLIRNNTPTNFDSGSLQCSGVLGAYETDGFVGVIIAASLQNAVDRKQAGIRLMLDIEETRKLAYRMLHLIGDSHSPQPKR